MKKKTTASGSLSRLYTQDDQGFWYLKETGELVGHADECRTTYQALSPLFTIFEDIRTRM